MYTFIDYLGQNGEVTECFVSFKKYHALYWNPLILFAFAHSSRYIFTFAIGAGPVTGLIIPELSSTRLRGKIMGFSFTAHWVGITVIVVHDFSF